MPKVFMLSEGVEVLNQKIHPLRFDDEPRAHSAKQEHGIPHPAQLPAKAVSTPGMALQVLVDSPNPRGAVDPVQNSSVGVGDLHHHGRLGGLPPLALSQARGKPDAPFSVEKTGEVGQLF